MVVAGGVEDELAEDLAGGGVDDGDVEVLDEESDVGSGVGSSDADVVESAVVAQRHGADAVDLVGADAVVSFMAAICRRAGLRAGGVGGRRSGSVLEGAVAAFVVVLVAEPVEECLELGEGGRLDGLGA